MANQIIILVYLWGCLVIMVGFICVWIIRNEILLRRKNTELYQEKLQERAMQAKQVAKPDPGIELHQYRGCVIKSQQSDLGWICLIFSNDMKTKIGNILDIVGTREESVRVAEEWIDEWKLIETGTYENKRYC